LSNVTKQEGKENISVRISSATALLELLPAPAGAGIVAADSSAKRKSARFQVKRRDGEKEYEDREELTAAVVEERLTERGDMIRKGVRTCYIDDGPCLSLNITDNEQGDVEQCGEDEKRKGD
jgi:hypothetical protein